jgi:hypothetical protein
MKEVREWVGRLLGRKPEPEPELELPELIALRAACGGLQERCLELVNANLTLSTSQFKSRETIARLVKILDTPPKKRLLEDLGWLDQLRTSLRDLGMLDG